MLIQYVTAEPPAHRMAHSAGVLPRGPLVLRDGWLVIETVTSQDRLSQFKDELEDAGVTYEVISITQSIDPTDLLTIRQRQFITEAVEHGYYDSPRGCSLTDLTAALNVSKPTASGILHRAEERIIKESLAKPNKHAYPVN